MGRKSKYSFETKLDIVLRYLNGKTSLVKEAAILCTDVSTINYWIRNYQSLGEEGLKNVSKNKSYSAEFKTQVVEEYLAGSNSFRGLCKKYGIPSDGTLRHWIKMYNSHEELKSSGTGGRIIMTNGRKTTYEERIEIVEYCIEHNDNYNETAEKYNVSYQQVYTWMRKYADKGVEGLVDRRGRTKPKEEMTELEQLRLEQRMLQAKIKRQEMEIALLKKLEELERGWD